MKKCNSGEVQHETSATQKKCNMKQSVKKCNMKKAARVKYAKKVHKNSSLECTDGSESFVDGPLYTGCLNTVR